MKPLAFIVEDDQTMADLLAELCEEQGFVTTVYADGDVAFKNLNKESPDLLLTDLQLPGKEGLEIIRAARFIDPKLPTVLITGFATVNSTREAFQQGVLDVITKPFDTRQVSGVLKRIGLLLDQRRELEQLNTRLRQVDSGLIKPVAKSPAMRSTIKLIEQVAPMDVHVLLSGATGTGKGLLARWIHHLSPRSEKAFFTVNAASLSQDLAESELFGHEKGAFTGAVSRKRGLLELAHGGTLLLDEVNSLTPTLQTKLLQFIQEKTIIRVGGERLISVDVRLLFASNESLDELVEAGQFRSDLYYRINVFQVDLPDLNTRQQDIAPLALAFVIQQAARLERPARSLSNEAIQWLQQHHWTGNVRELENLIQRAVVLCNEEEIGIEYFPLQTPNRLMNDKNIPVHPATLEQVENWWIKHTLQEMDNNKTQAAKALGIDVTTLHRKLRK